MYEDKSPCFEIVKNENQAIIKIYLVRCLPGFLKLILMISFGIAFFSLTRLILSLL